MASKKIVVLGTGGTIAGTARQGADHLTYSAAQLGVAQLLAAIPALASVPLEAEQVAQVDSKDMDAIVWQRLAGRCAHWLAQPDVQGVVITHGTDTLEETAWFLQRVLAPAKPVVLACAMRPATALVPDGPQNLVDAVAVARDGRIAGVSAVCAGRVHGAREVAKVHPYRIDAFDSAESGALGVVEEGRLRLLRTDLPTVASRSLDSSYAPDAVTLARAVAQVLPADWPRVEIVMNHAGAGGAIVQALVAQGVDGLVAAGTGNGTLATSLQTALLQAQAQGVAVLRSTRCAQGRVLPHDGDVLPDSQGLSPVKARVELVLRLLGKRAAHAA